MKFLKDVYCSIKYMIVFRSLVSCSRCGIEWDKSSQRLEPHMSHFQLFHHLVHRSHFDPQTISFFQIRQPKKYFKHSCKKNIIIPASLCSKVFLLLCQGDQLNVAWWTEQGFFFLPAHRPPTNLSRKLPQTQLPNRFESHLTEFPFFLPSLFQNYFRCFFQDFMFSSRFLNQFLISGCVFAVSSCSNILLFL